VEGKITTATVRKACIWFGEKKTFFFNFETVNKNPLSLEELRVNIDEPSKFLLMPWTVQQNNVE